MEKVKFTDPETNEVVEFVVEDETQLNGVKYLLVYEDAEDGTLDAYILKEVGDSTNRGAQYVCAIAHVLENGEANVYTGVCEGEIAYKVEGEKGFGYDPIFYYPSYKTTLANVSEDEKNAISHRGNAIVKLLEGMKK